MMLYQDSRLRRAYASRPAGVKRNLPRDPGPVMRSRYPNSTHPRAAFIIDAPPSREGAGLSGSGSWPAARVSASRRVAPPGTRDSSLRNRAHSRDSRRSLSSGRQCRHPLAADTNARHAPQGSTPSVLRFPFSGPTPAAPIPESRSPGLDERTACERRSRREGRGGACAPRSRTAAPRVG